MHTRGPCRPERTTDNATESSQQGEALKARHEKLLAGLDGFHGTERWFRHWTRRFTYTEGIKYLADEAGAYWLIDVIASWSRNEELQKEPFVVWELKVQSDRTASLAAGDGNDRTLMTQTIPLTDFPLEGITLYLTDGVLLLPGEF